MSNIVNIARRFNGPPESGNGGYAAGMIAGLLGQNVNVRLLRPLPLEADITVDAIGEKWEVRCEGQLIAVASSSMPRIAPPPPPSYIEALGVSKHFVGFGTHAFPTCFVCGPSRRRGDGLCIFPGAVPGTSVVAAPWLPDESLSDGQGKVRPEFVWAALDCPGYFALSPRPEYALLGELSVHIDRLVHIDEPCVVVGWPLDHHGRKYRAGTALFDEDGERCAVGVATWIDAGKPVS